MLINLSNHPSAKWDKKQKDEAEKQFGEIIDEKFPQILPEASYDDILELVDKYTEKCSELVKQKGHNKNAVHVMGEMTFVFQFVKKMAEEGMLCIASTTDRKTEEYEDGSMKKEFKFIQFRPYTTDLF
ncbi:MAG: CRISPR-associated protein [Candidatus Zhuqueibacterota bacterium]